MCKDVSLAFGYSISFSNKELSPIALGCEFNASMGKKAFKELDTVLNVLWEPVFVLSFCFLQSHGC